MTALPFLLDQLAELLLYHLPLPGSRRGIGTPGKTPIEHASTTDLSVTGVGQQGRSREGLFSSFPPVLSRVFRLMIVTVLGEYTALCTGRAFLEQQRACSVGS